MSELKFRNLYAEEIDVRINSVNKGGVSLLLYKDARADQNILDETVGPLNWQRKHLRDNANCIVEIYDASKGQWIAKEDTGKESFDEKEKGLASDSFKRACVNFGIGRELYTAPDIFIFGDKLDAFSAGNGDERPSCYNRFKVGEIEYQKNPSGEDTKSITKVRIDVYDKYGKKKIYSETFYKSSSVATPTAKPQVANNSTPTPIPTPTSSVTIPDDEIILMGNCRGKKYGEVKDTPIFKSFLNWVASTKTSYTDEKTAEQFRKFKAIATA